MTINYDPDTSWMGIQPEAQTCLNCKYFCLHYGILNGCMRPLYIGHCGYPRLKHRDISDTCVNFVSKYTSQSAEKTN